MALYTSWWLPPSRASGAVRRCRRPSGGAAPGSGCRGPRASTVHACAGPQGRRPPHHHVHVATHSRPRQPPTPLFSRAHATPPEQPSCVPFFPPAHKPAILAALDPVPPPRSSQAGPVRFMAAQSNWSSVLQDPRANWTALVPSEQGFREHGGVFLRGGCAAGRGGGSGGEEAGICQLWMSRGLWCWMVSRGAAGGHGLAAGLPMSASMLGVQGRIQELVGVAGMRHRGWWQRSTGLLALGPADRSPCPRLHPHPQCGHPPVQPRRLPALPPGRTRERPLALRWAHKSAPLLPARVAPWFGLCMRLGTSGLLLCQVCFPLLCWPPLAAAPA